MGRDAGSNISDASSRRGQPEAALTWRSLQSIVADSAISEWHKRLQLACVDEKEHFDHLLWYAGSSADRLRGLNKLDILCATVICNFCVITKQLTCFPEGG